MTIHKGNFLQALRDNIANGTLDQAEVLTALATSAPAQFPEYAERVDTDDDLEVDDNPLYSRSDSGVWVSAWVWVPDLKSEP
jgi:hypothetical protein